MTDAKRGPPRRFRPRVLLLEDEVLTAMDIALTLQREGYEVLGPCRTNREVREVIGAFHPDVALLDIKLGADADSFEVAGLLHDAEIPFAFLSGHTQAVIPLPIEFADRPRFVKPVGPRTLVEAIEGLLAADAGP